MYNFTHRELRKIHELGLIGEIARIAKQLTASIAVNKLSDSDNKLVIISSIADHAEEIANILVKVLPIICPSIGEIKDEEAQLDAVYKHICENALDTVVLKVGEGFFGLSKSETTPPEAQSQAKEKKKKP